MHIYTHCHLHNLSLLPLPAEWPSPLIIHNCSASTGAFLPAPLYRIVAYPHDLHPLFTCPTVQICYIIESCLTSIPTHSASTKFTAGPGTCSSANLLACLPYHAGLLHNPHPTHSASTRFTAGPGRQVMELAVTLVTLQGMPPSKMTFADALTGLKP